MARSSTLRKQSTRAAAKEATAPRYFQYCNVRPSMPRAFGPGVNADRASAINVLGDKWVNGTELSYYFFDKPGDGESLTMADGSVSFMRWSGAASQ